jgi:hypothetical protein
MLRIPHCPDNLPFFILFLTNWFFPFFSLPFPFFLLSFIFSTRFTPPLTSPFLSYLPYFEKMESCRVFPNSFRFLCSTYHIKLNQGINYSHSFFRISCFLLPKSLPSLKYLYQKDKRALPGNFQNRRFEGKSKKKVSCLPVKCIVSRYLRPLSFLSLSLSPPPPPPIRTLLFSYSSIAVFQAGYKSPSEVMS